MTRKRLTIALPASQIETCQVEARKLGISVSAYVALVLNVAHGRPRGAAEILRGCSMTPEARARFLMGSEDEEG